jgi:hypothetical protein
MIKVGKRNGNMLNETSLAWGFFFSSIKTVYVFVAWSSTKSDGMDGSV